jgi:hypothetical protein
MFDSFRISLRRGGALWMAVTGPLLAGSCGVEEEPLFDDVESLAPLAGRSGNLPSFSQRPEGAGGRSGAVGAAGRAGSKGNPAGVARQGQGVDAGLPRASAGEPPDAGGDAGQSCELDSDCNDADACTLDACTRGSCEHAPASTGVACGSRTASECTLADVCDGAGRCVPNDLPADTPCGRVGAACAADTCDGAGRCVPRNLPADTPCGVSSGCGQPSCDAAGVCVPHAAANGSACPGGSCSVGACVQGQRVGCPQAVVTSVPFETSWSSAGLPDLFEGSCESEDTPDFALVFVVPAAGRYRFETTGSADSVLTLASGACSAGNGAQLNPCNDDISENNRNSRIDVTLAAAQTLSVYVSEFGDENTGQCTLRITAL